MEFKEKWDRWEKKENEVQEETEGPLEPQVQLEKELVPLRYCERPTCKLTYPK